MYITSEARMEKERVREKEDRTGVEGQVQTGNGWI